MVVRWAGQKQVHLRAMICDALDEAFGRKPHVLLRSPFLSDILVTSAILSGGGQFLRSLLCEANIRTDRAPSGRSRHQRTVQSIPSEGRPMNIAFIGLGNMGSPMARHLVKAGHHVTVWNRTAAKAEPLKADGVKVARSLSEAATGAEIVIT